MWIYIWEERPTNGQTVWVRIKRYNWPPFQATYDAYTGNFTSTTNNTIWNRRYIYTWRTTN